MKNVQRDQPFLHVLKENKCKKCQKILLENCNKDIIQTLTDILYNVMNGNVHINDVDLQELKKYKNTLKKIFDGIQRKRTVKARRNLFVQHNQKGGFWPILARIALQLLVALTSEKLLQNDNNNKK